MQSRRRSNLKKAWGLFSLVVTALILILVNALFSITKGLFQRGALESTVFLLEATVDQEDTHEVHKNELLSFGVKDEAQITSEQLQCRFPTCFDLSSCKTGFRIFTANPTSQDLKDRIRSPVYLKMLMSIRQSMFYTSDSSNACLYVPITDTLDRDRLSRDFVRRIEKRLSDRGIWNRNGKNFLVFNLFSGTWPNYTESLGFDYGYAMLAKASVSGEKHRIGFDISFPLFPKDHPQIQRTYGCEGCLFPIERKYKLAFKGKRYLFGIGSDVRDLLHLLHNDRDVILLTTCRHGKNWQDFADTHCFRDNKLYERYDYQELLYNTTFCLVPRGRRLGSFRFLESLQAGCIPVVMSDGWELPFSSVIDWSRAALHINEKSLLHVPTILRSISYEQILSMKQQCLFLYFSYFSSIQQIVNTAIKIVHDRVVPHNAHSYHMWNYPPGALSVHTTFSTQLIHFPFYYNLLGVKPLEKFTAIILITAIEKSGKFFKLIRTINQSQYIHQILVIWLAPVRIPEKSSWPPTGVTLRVIYPKQKVLSARFLDSSLIETDAVFAFNDDVVIPTSAINFAFRQWMSFPDQIIGFTPRDHFWSPTSNSWVFTSRKSNSFSMVMMNAAVYHRYYNHLYTNNLPKEVWQMMTHHSNCEDLVMNFLASSVNNKPPIVISHPHHFDEGEREKEIFDMKKSHDDTRRRNERFKTKQNCFRELVRIFGRVTLRKSVHKINPLLFKDPISNFKKRYREFE